MTALGGKAEDDGKGAWNVTCGESTATVDADDGKTKVDGKRASGNGFSTYTDQDKNRFLRFSAGACGDPWQDVYRSR